MKLSNEQQSYNLDFLSPDIRTSPVIKIDFKGRILYANSASFELLHEWLFPANEYLPEHFLKSNPEILNPDVDFSVPFKMKSTNWNFDVIGFKECGYIGLYGSEAVSSDTIVEAELKA